MRNLPYKRFDGIFSVSLSFIETELRGVIENDCVKVAQRGVFQVPFFRESTWYHWQSFCAISATCLPWKWAIASSFSVG
jgi:hypothetical protein